MLLADDAYSGLVYSIDPVLLLFGDREERLAEAREAAERADCRVVDAVRIANGVARLDDHVGDCLALVTASAPGPGFDALLARIAGAARAGRMRGMIVAPASMIDLIAEADLPDSVEHLVDPDADQLEAEIRAAGAPTASAFHEINRRNGVPVLQQLSEDVARIASVLASLSEEDGAAREEEGEDRADAGFVRAIIRARRLRDQFFRGELFADPAFDMLLDLYAARLEGARVAVSSLCIAAAVPATTALRWIKALTDRGLFVRAADPQDGRRVYIGLSDDAARAMGRYLNAVQKSGLPAV